MKKLILAATLCMTAGHLFTASAKDTPHPDFTFSSGEQRVNMLELFTSEGCSSCPPADQWLGKLVDHPRLWEDIVPLAFHVDYWNYLGWEDDFSRSENSTRQRRYKEEGGINSVYTPGFVLNGEEWRGWYSQSNLPQAEEDAGVLTVAIKDGKLEVSYENEKQTNNRLDLQVALLGFDITTKVRGGENRGRELVHQFVVLAHDSDSSRTAQWSLPAPKSDIGTDKLGLAVWVTEPNSQRPLQATGGWLQ